MKRLFVVKLVLFVLLSGLVSCTSFLSPKSDTEQKKDTSEMDVSTVIRPVHVYFLGDFPTSLGQETISELKKVYPSVKYEGHIPLPDSAYYQPRNRYLAPKLLDTMMGLQKNGNRVLGFTTKDISLKYKEHENWGVMGLSYLNKRACVISTFRLNDPTRRKEHFIKLMLHEMGHVEGLNHCNLSETCLMRDANGKNRFSELNGFCSECKNYLIDRGWMLD